MRIMKLRTGGTSCGIIKKIRKEVADSVHYAEISRKTYPHKYRRSAAKAIERANDLIESNASGLKQMKKIRNQVLRLIPTLYTGSDRVDPKTLNKMKSVLSDLDLVKRGTC